MVFFVVFNIIQDFILVVVFELINFWIWNLNLNVFGFYEYFFIMYVLFKFVLLGVCVVQLVMGLFEFVERCEVNFFKCNVDDWINREIFIVWEKFFCNIGFDGCVVCNQGVFVGVVVVSFFCFDFDCKVYWFFDIICIC